MKAIVLFILIVGSKTPNDGVSYTFSPAVPKATCEAMLKKIADQNTDRFSSFRRPKLLECVEVVE